MQRRVAGSRGRDRRRRAPSPCSPPPPRRAGSRTPHRPLAVAAAAQLDPSVPAAVYDVDGFETRAATWRPTPARSQGICYLDVGTWESYRPDAGLLPPLGDRQALRRLPRRALARRLSLPALAPLCARFAICRTRASTRSSPTTWPATKTTPALRSALLDQLRFNRWIARVVHRQGMAVALKNDPAQVRQLLGDFDFAVVESCFDFDECDSFLPFIRGQGRLPRRVRAPPPSSARTACGVARTAHASMARPR